MVIDRLALSLDDHLLDLACGDGSVAAFVASSVSALLAVERSAANVAAAQWRLGSPGVRFVTGSAPGFTATIAAPWRFTAALWRGGFVQGADGEILATLHALYVRFRRVDRVLLVGTSSQAERGGPSDIAHHGKAQVASFATATGWRTDFEPDGGTGEEEFNLLLTRAPV